MTTRKPSFSALIAVAAMGVGAIVRAQQPGAQKSQGASVDCNTITQDKKSAVMTAIPSLRAVSFCEVIPVCGAGGIYGTSGLNEPKDSCPWAIWSGLDAAALAKQNQVERVLLNPPRGRRFWVMDSVELPVAPTVRDFGGLKAHWWAELPAGTEGREPYVPAPVARKSTLTFNKGNSVVLLDDPDGITWILKAYATAVDPSLTYDTLPTLGTKLKLPNGWKFRSKVLDRDLLISSDGIARILWDDLQNAWDACDPGMCNYRP